MMRAPHTILRVSGRLLVAFPVNTRGPVLRWLGH